MGLSLLFHESGMVAKVGELRIDATVKEEHSSSLKVTDHPIESGAVITDHLILEPESLSIDGVISEYPLRHFSATPKQGDDPLALRLGSSSGSRAKDAFDTLRRLQASGALLTVITGLKMYTDMVLVSFSTPRDSQSGAALQFSAELRHIVRVESQVVSMPEQKAKAKRRRLQRTEASPGEITDLRAYQISTGKQPMHAVPTGMSNMLRPIEQKSQRSGYMEPYANRGGTL